MRTTANKKIDILNSIRESLDDVKKQVESIDSISRENRFILDDIYSKVNGIHNSLLSSDERFDDWRDE